MIPGRGLIARARSLWRGVRGRSRVDAEMNEEFRLHLDLRTEDLVRSGLSRPEAARRARLEFGSMDQYKDEGSASRGLRRVDQLRVSWLDFKLGFRMLVRYPGLTLVGGLAMAFAIWVGSATFELATQLLRPTLPLDDGGRIVGLRNWDAASNGPERRASHDFFTWRAELKSVEDLGAFRQVKRNLITADGQAEPVDIAEISASAFRIARVPPLLGRPLVAADERRGAPPVVVIGYDVWQSRFAGATNVIGQTVRVGGVHSTVVGVMPKSFAFPVANSFWVPLGIGVSDNAPREGPAISIFGRLAPGASLRDAQAELTALGGRAAAAFRDTHEHLRPQVMPYANSILDVSGWKSAAAMSVNLPMLMLLVLICANVALLMFARAATREGEIAVRSALGAGRGRIIMQLFAEALVLGGVAATVGLAAARFGLRWVMTVVEAEMLHGDKLPFWFTDSLSPTTVLYAIALTMLAAVIAGVVPGLKVTRGMGERLKAATAGSGGIRFGGLWTAIIVAQVAVTVAFPAVTFFVRRDGVQIRAIDVGFPEKEYLTVRLEMDRETAGGAPADTSRAAFFVRFKTTYEELERRLAADPAVVGVAFADLLPHMYHPHRLIEVDEGGAAPLNPEWPAYRVSAASVGRTFFDVVQARALAGREFNATEYESGGGAPGVGRPDFGARFRSVPGRALSDHSRNGAANVVIVNQSFVKLVLGDRNPIGRRLRYVDFEERSERKPTNAAPAPWYEIVGVVRDMGMSPPEDPKVAGIYHPVATGDLYPVTMAVHVKGDPASFAPRVRALATAVDPTLRLHDFVAMDHISDSELQFVAFWFRLLLAMTVIALILSLAGIYSVMSFTVARRTREIGIRIALGANQRSVVLAIFARPLTQVALGVVAGAILITVIAMAGSYAGLSLKQIAIILSYATVMLAVCLLACVVPTRRALRVQPTEALRSEG